MAGCVRASEAGRKLDGRCPRMKCVASCQEGHFCHVWVQCRGGDRLRGIAERAEDILEAPLGELESRKRQFGCLKGLGSGMKDLRMLGRKP